MGERDGHRKPGPSEGALPIGSLLDSDRYRLDKPLGRGGFAITYLAQDLRLHRPVAIKELFPERARRSGTSVVVPGAAADDFARARDRFLREATTLALFGHPSIVRIFAVFEEHGTAYLVLERLDGRTLGEELRVRRGPFSEAEALDVAGQAATALWVVHRAGVLHRDVSPANLVRTGDGRIVLIDFGLARPDAFDRTTSMTRIVTPGYAPPEQYAGSARFSARADVYALGATLYRLLAGRTPPDAAARALGQDLDPLWRVNPTVSRRVSDALAAALALDPEGRPPTVRRLLDQMGVATDGLDMADEAEADGPGGPTSPMPGSTSLRPVAPPDADGRALRPADPDVPTEHVLARAPAPTPGPGPAPELRPGAPEDRADPSDPDGATEVLAPRSSLRPAGHGRTRARPPDADGSGPGPPRAAVRPAAHVVPAPLPAPAAAPDGPAALPVQLGGPTGPLAGRAWLTLPLGLAALALASAQPLPMTLVLALGVGPVLATWGDRVLQPHRSRGWMLGWWLRNLGVGVVRALGAVIVLGVGIGLWYLTQAITAFEGAGPWVLRATGVAAAGIVCLSLRRGGPGFRSNLALDALARRLMPRGALTMAAGVVLVVAVALGAVGLWFQPEAWPLGV